MKDERIKGEREIKSKPLQTTTTSAECESRRLKCFCFLQCCLRRQRINTVPEYNGSMGDCRVRVGGGCCRFRGRLLKRMWVECSSFSMYACICCCVYVYVCV